ncbi:MAG: AI-2E family transporter [Anaerolineae bacterium]|nr:AI-2E family transporter [Phycisphaerae bacterium]
MSEPAPNVSFTRRVMIAVAITLAAIILVYFVWQAAYVLMLVFAGVLLAIFLRTLAEVLMRVAPLSMKWALTVVIAAILAVSVAGVWLLAPSVYQQADELSREIPKAMQSAKEKAETYPAVQRVLSGDSWKRIANPESSPFIARITKFANSALGALLAFVLVLFIGFYFAYEPALYTNGILRLIPREHREYAAEILGAIGYTLRWWMIAQFIDMWIIGIATAIGLWLLGVKLALVFGILAGIFNIIPNFGPLVSLVPATLIALAHSPQTAMHVVIMYLILQTLEGYVLLPMLQRKAVDTPPVVLIGAQVFMGYTLGALGLLLAAPLVAAVMVMVKMLYVEETLGDEIDTPDDKLKRKDVPTVPGKRTNKNNPNHQDTKNTKN